MGDAFKSAFGVTMQTTKREGVTVMGKRRFPLCKTAVLNLYYIVSHTVYCISFYRIPLVYISAVLPVLYLLEIGKTKSASYRVLKFMRLTLN